MLTPTLACRRPIALGTCESLDHTVRGFDFGRVYLRSAQKCECPRPLSEDQKLFLTPFLSFESHISFVSSFHQ